MGFLMVSNADFLLEDIHFPQDALFGFAGKYLEDYFQKNPPVEGTPLLLYSSLGRLHQYRLVTVEQANVGPLRKIMISHPCDDGSRTFYRDGSNCRDRSGPERIIPVVGWVGQQLGKSVRIVFSWDWQTSTTSEL